ncbi:hypothetical protein A2U01_0057307, partial [Trifolium medium]|nr:hypothetical protein [Trifolium medium]
DTALPVDLKGESFCALLGARSRYCHPVMFWL